ncbi:MAG: hypothetical protein RJA57_1521 [Bacteroidota bacterium]|jgi:glyoxylase-like metal-dependent hydrolase (beta-lactamase superfamily II)
MLHVVSHTFSPVQENTYILHDGAGHACIIDPGCYFPAERQTLCDGIAALGTVPRLLLNTHCHLDHVFGNRFVHETWGLPLHIHPDELPVLKFAPEAGVLWQLPFDNYEGPLVYLEAGETVRVGSEELQVLLVPGHSPGHLAFYHAAGGYLIGGDVLFRQSVGRTDLPGGDLETLTRSIRAQFYTLPDETVVYPGHGPTTTIGFEKQHNPFVPG